MPQLDRLGLKENPFNSSTSQQFFYADQGRAQIMETTEHLIDFSNNLQVIIGAHGVGKSHFLEALQNRRGHNWQVVKIEDTTQYDTLSLIQAIMNAFGANSDSTAELLESLENQLSEIIQLGSRPVLLIDNAQTLSSDSIRFLMQLSQQEQNDEPYIHIILFSTSVITETLQSPEFKEFRDIVHIAILDNFDKEGVSGYLRHKLAVAGFNRESPFTPRIVESIYNDSSGLPEKINFFAEKFLASSGKGENYIDSKNHLSDTISTDNSMQIPTIHNEDELSQEDADIGNSDFAEPLVQEVSKNKLSTDDKMSIFNDTNINDEKTDRIDEQLSRLTEQFDEIEKMTDQSEEPSFFNRELIEEYTYHHSDTNNSEQINSQDNNEAGGLNLAKIVIPATTIMTILIAVFAINSLFNQNSDIKPDSREQVELFPLELPPEGTFEIEEKIIETPVVSEKSQEIQVPDKMIETTAVAEPVPETKVSEIIESVEVIDTIEVIQAAEADKNSIDSKEIIEQTVEAEETITTKVVSNIRPEINIIEPSPIIGSQKRQIITIKGQNFSSDMKLILFFDNKEKIFSRFETPNQWQYVNNNIVKLHLTTGISNQEWSLQARTKNSVQSNTASFKIVKPFNRNLLSKARGAQIDRISPNPAAGSNNRQTLTILGQGFSEDSIIELSWDKNKKQFSRLQTPTQFKYYSAGKLQLFITTGSKERQWGVSLIAKNNSQLSTSSFNVSSENNTSTTNTLKNASIKGRSWLLQQVDNEYTLQLFGSRDKSAIAALIRKYSLTGDIARFETQQDGQSWYSMTFGIYKSKEEANAAIASLNPKLTTPKPWIRSFSSIQKQLRENNPSIPAASSIPGNNIATQSRIRNTAWIWTQNPADYTIQVVTLSTEQAIKDFARKQNIERYSTQFAIKSNGKILHVLVYGVYSNKESADKAKAKLTSRIKSIIPWVRSFSDIHELMSGVRE